MFISDGDTLEAAVTDEDGRFLKSGGIDFFQDGLQDCDEYTFAKMRGYFSLIGITYQLQLLMFCFYKAFIAHKYDTLPLATEKVGISQFHNIVLYDKNKATCIQVKYVDEEKAHNSIGFTELFPRGKRKWEGMFSINRYFSSFIQYEADEVKHLVIYTNIGLDLTEEKKISRSNCSIVFFPLKFDVIDIEEENYKIVKDFIYR